MVAQEAALHIIAQKSEGCMRDALSMLDRIASFTNGMLTYNGTMEHLNLLDADFYFGLTDSILSQDVAGTLLTFDKALEKGFEGDVVINGLAEHFRNLLLCKDARMAKLLDVPNDHKPIFNEKANQAPPSFLLSSLNVLNQCELEYKNTNNKRLHVEMCLIRLCYVLSAVSSASLGQQNDADGVKKNSDSVGTGIPAPLASSPLPLKAPPAPVAYTQPQVKQEVHTPQASFNAPPAPAAPPPPPPVASAPIPAPSVPPVAVVTPRPASVPSPGRKLSKGLLDDIDSDVDLEKDKRTHPLTHEECLQLLEEYRQQLTAQGKSTLSSQFSLMRLEFYPPDEICFISPSELTDTYARDQKGVLIDYYRERTKLMVRVTTKLVEDEAVITAQQNTVLSKQEMFDAMAMKNPNLARLKEGLGMQVEY